MADTRDVEIVVAYTDDHSALDLDRIGTVVTMSRREARRMVDGGEARYADVARDEADRPLADLNSRAVLGHLRRLGLPEVPGESKSSMITRIDEREAAQRTGPQPDEPGEVKPQAASADDAGVAPTKTTRSGATAPVVGTDGSPAAAQRNA